MALSLTTLGAAASNTTWMSQVQGGLQNTVTAILAEAGSTADYVVRRKFAQWCEKNLAQAAALVAVPVATQVQASNPTTYSDLNSVSDTHVNNALSALFTQLAYANILPS